LAHGDLTAAIEAFDRACVRKPGYLGAWVNLGLAYQQIGRYTEAARALERAFSLESSERNRLAWAAALAEDGVRRRDKHCLIRAKECLSSHDWSAGEQIQAIALLARICEAQGLLSDAVALYINAIALKPDHPGYHNNAARCLTKLGRISEAADHYYATYLLAPEFPEAFSSALNCLNYGSSETLGSYQEAVSKWEQSIARRYYPNRPSYENDRSPGKPLRVGYLSPDLRQHVVGMLFLPILERHDRSKVFAVCYHVEPRFDEMSGRISRSADLWRHLFDKSDEEIAAQIRADEIDILVDLSGHTAYARPLVFARKPAPVQVSWLGYYCTTGLATMDWYITDIHSSGSDQDALFIERLYRLPETRICYVPYSHMMEVSELPCKRTGGLTFGCLNNIAKLNPDVLRLWARILERVRESRLLIQSTTLRDGPNRERFIASCLAHGIGRERLDIRDALPIDEFSGTYSEIDIALDPFPFCGGVTSFDALWMGVPVVTLEQEHLAGRQTLSMLKNLGLGDLIASDPNEYVEIAVTLANDTARLEELRRGLRGHFRSSPLLNHRQFTRDLEAAFRHFWQAWLANQPPSCSSENRP
jgi:predicted O-linked N-acetylglucosamine transferase (SPINDLY family)